MFTRPEEVVRLAHEIRGDLTIVARARDADHATELYELGATDAIPETIEASLQLAETVLVDIGVPDGLSSSPRSTRSATSFASCCSRPTTRRARGMRSAIERSGASIRAGAYRDAPRKRAGRRRSAPHSLHSPSAIVARVSGAPTLK